MKKLLFAVLIFSACKKEPITTPPTVYHQLNVWTSGTKIQDFVFSSDVSYSTDTTVNSYYDMNDSSLYRLLAKGSSHFILNSGDTLYGHAGAGTPDWVWTKLNISYEKYNVDVVKLTGSYPYKFWVVMHGDTLSGEAICINNRSAPFQYYKGQW